MSLPPITEDDYNALASYEYECFELIEKAISYWGNRLPRFVVADSLALRAHLQLKRDFEDDIDIVFPSYTDPEEVLSVIHDLPEKPSIIMPTQYFIRAKYILPHTDRLWNDFRIDFHIGGIWYKDQCFHIDDQIIQSAKCGDILSSGDFYCLNLPVLPLDDLLIIKLERLQGKDKQDIISILSAGCEGLIQLASKVLLRGTAPTVVEHANIMLDTFEKQLVTWTKDFNRVMTSEKSNLCKQALSMMIKQLT